MQIYGVVIRMQVHETKIIHNASWPEALAEAVINDKDDTAAWYSARNGHTAACIEPSPPLNSVHRNSGAPERR